MFPNVTPSAGNRLVLSTNKTGTVWFGFVSLFPPTWKDRLLNLWKGVDREVREQFPIQLMPSDPYVVAAGIDTWYLNRIDPSGLLQALRRALDELQARAAEDEEEVDAP